MPHGVKSAADIVITYNFAEAKTLKQRLEDATKQGEAVDWTVTYNGATIKMKGKFWFSDAATTIGTNIGGNCPSGLSSAKGAWGAANGNVNGNCAAGKNGACPKDFWGVQMNTDADAKSCYVLHMGGAQYAAPSMKTFMQLERDRVSDAQKQIDEENSNIILQLWKRLIAGDVALIVCLLVLCSCCCCMCFCIRKVMYAPLPSSENQQLPKTAGQKAGAWISQHASGYKQQR